MNSLTYFKTLFQKEIWEFKGVMFWLPAILVALMIVLPLAQLSYMYSQEIGTPNFAMIAMELSQDSEKAQRTALMLGTGLSAMFMPFTVVCFFVQLYYFSSAMYDERKDRSILFWRSLPVSDMTNVSVKVLSGLFLLPAMFLLAATLTSLIYLLLTFLATVVMSLGGVSFWSVWTHIELISWMPKLWLTLIPYALWMAPVYLYLLLISEISSKAPFLWAVLPVGVVLIMEAILYNNGIIADQSIGESLVNYIAFTDIPHGHMAVRDISEVAMAPFHAIWDKINLIALAAGAVMFFATYWLRKNKSDI